MFLPTLYTLHTALCSLHTAHCPAAATLHVHTATLRFDTSVCHPPLSSLSLSHPHTHTHQTPVLTVTLFSGRQHSNLSRHTRTRYTAPNRWEVQVECQCSLCINYQLADKTNKKKLLGQKLLLKNSSSFAGCSNQISVTLSNGYTAQCVDFNM